MEISGDGVASEIAMTEWVAGAHSRLIDGPKKRAPERYANGVQTLFGVVMSEEDRRQERRKMCRQIGLFRFERECRSVVVGKRRLKAWRVPGEVEFKQHAEMVARVAAEFP